MTTSATQNVKTSTQKLSTRVLIFQPMDTYYIRYITAEALVVVVVVDDDDGDDDDDTTMQKNCTFPQQRC